MYFITRRNIDYYMNYVSSTGERTETLKAETGYFEGHTPEALVVF
jgi:hypothetical protein